MIFQRYQGGFGRSLAVLTLKSRAKKLDKPAVLRTDKLIQQKGNAQSHGLLHSHLLRL